MPTWLLDYALESALRREHLPAGLVGDELHDNGSWLVLGDDCGRCCEV